MRLRVGHQHSQFWPILVHFLHYYSAFWGPRVISAVDDPRGAFTCPSSTLTVLANSVLFHGLLLPVLGSQSDLHSCPKVRLRVGHQHSRFWPILARFVDYYSLFWGPGVISMINAPRCAFTCRLSTLAVFVYSDPFRGLLLTVLGSQSDFHGC